VLKAVAPVAIPRLLRGGPAALQPCRLMPSLDRVEWEYLRHVLTCCQGNKSEAARMLGIHRSVLQRKLSKATPA
jgi:ActR/RegA family two-component response regulator